MSEPPPSPLDTSASSPSNDHRSNIPWRPSLGSQKLFFTPSGLRGKDPGGYGLPRSRTRTLRSASARRQAVTDPPKPDPTTTASKCSSTKGPSRQVLAHGDARCNPFGVCAQIWWRRSGTNRRPREAEARSTAAHIDRGLDQLGIEVAVGGSQPGALRR